MIDYTHIESIDPAAPTPGGVESLIRDLISFMPDRFSLVGVVREDERHPGEWLATENFSNGLKETMWLPIARLQAAGKRGLVPDSIKMACGLIVHSRKLSRDTTYIVHRIEIGAILKFLKRRYVLMLHNDSVGLLGRASESRWKSISPLFRMIENFAVRNASRVVTFSSAELKRLSKLNPKTAHFLTWYDERIFQASEKQKTDDSTRFEIVWVGRFESQKNPLLAVLIARELEVRQLPYTLTFCGSGSLRAEMETKISELADPSKVTIMSGLDRVGVAKELSTKRIMLMTSHSEGCPVSLAEAGAMGLVCIVNSACDADSFIENGVNGQRTPESDARNFVDAIVTSATFSREICIQRAAKRKSSIMIPQLLEFLDSPH